ncbi:OLC1v1011448C2 [Oldenlandia corymbosa var. corymbosa]|uniref:OLC1v1011448C2 n=1 Tax=Oldenlandia corymbosa var. corymbosa TaxID=529605 RepID=A0AAV1DWV5_OLDCO|nr:OLC1v1011448C2 [Oldenlandia corymbosa var. corymbosa]
MSRSNGFYIHFAVLLISTFVFTQNFPVLASPVDQQRFKRPDPLSRFKPYNGSYDVTNRHYWASAAFTGVHGYAIAGIWLLFGFGLGSYLIVKNCIGRASSVVNRPDSVYITLFSLVVFFTLLAIVASGFILAANERSHKRVNRLIDTIYGAANDASQAMRRVINSLVDMQTRLGPYDQQTSDLLNVTTHRLRRESLLIQNFVDKTKHPSDKVVEVLYSTTLAVVIVNLSLLVAALVLLILHWYPGIMVIIFCCWILTSLSWLLTGLDYFFQTFAHDTCAAFGTFEQNPTNSSLRFIHPCQSPDQSNKLLAQIGHTVHDFIFQLNTKLTELKSVFQIEEGKDNIIGIREICNPFSGAPNYTYAPQYCAKDTTQIGDLSIVSD